MERWIRLDLAWEDSPWLDALDGAAAGCWPRLLVWVKRDGARGRCKQAAPGVLSRRWRLPKGTIEEFLKAAVTHGALVIDGTDWVVTGWEKYQKPDPTVKERVERHRLRKVTPVTPVTAGNAVTGSYPSRDGDGYGEGAVDELDSEKKESSVGVQGEGANAPGGADGADAPGPSSGTDDKQPEPKTKRLTYDPNNPWHQEVTAIADWFYAQPGRRQPATKTQREKSLDIIRRVLEYGCPETPKPQRAARFKAALTAILADDWWKPQVLSIGANLIRGKDGEAPKWIRAEAQIAAKAKANGTQASGKPREWGKDTDWILEPDGSQVHNDPELRRHLIQQNERWRQNGAWTDPDKGQPWTLDSNYLAQPDTYPARRDKELADKLERFRKQREAVGP